MNILNYIITGPMQALGCKNSPTPFPGRMSYKVTKPGLICVLYHSMLYLYRCLLGPFYVLLILFGLCSVFWLFELGCVMRVCAGQLIKQIMI